MALFASDGFDMYNGTQSSIGLLANWLFLPNTNAPGPVSNYCSMTSGRFSGQGLSMAAQSQGAAVYKPFSTGGVGAVSFGFALLLNGSDVSGLSGGTATLFYQGAPLIAIGITSSLAINVGSVSWSSFFGTISVTPSASSPSGTLQYGNWQYVELCVQGGASGSITVYVQGVQVCSATGLSLPTLFDGAGFWTPQPNSPYVVDDMYLATTTGPLGPLRVSTLRPNGAGASTQWSPLSGANYANVNETLVDGDTSYVQTNTVGNSDLYTVNSLPITPASIFGVNVVTFAKTTDANPRTLYAQIRSGASSTVYTGSAISLSGGYFRYERMLTVDPATASAWTSTNINSAQIGPNLAS